MSSIENIDKWDVIRHRLKTGEIGTTFIEFANMCSKKFMEEEPEPWYRFCDGENTETAFHKEWLDMFLESDHIAIESAREHHKTSWVLNLILFLLWRNENYDAIYFSATHGQAVSKLKEFKLIWERNREWLNLEPDKGNWSKTYRQFENGSSIKAEGWGTAVEGPHVQLIIMDDILQERGAMDDEEVWDFYTNIVSPMITESGKIVLVGTKKRRGDIFDRIQKNPEWQHGKYPSTIEKPIFPEKWPAERLKAKKREQGSRSFNREFGLEVILEEEVLIPPSWNEKNIDREISYPEDWQGGLNVLGFDPAISPTGDYAAFFAMSLNNQGNRQILHVSRQKGMSLNDMLFKMNQLDTRYGFQVIIVEQNSFQKLIVQEAIERTSLPIEGHTTGKTKSDPSEGVPRIAVLFENGKYLYPYKEDKDIEKTDMVFNALNSLLYDKGKLENNHTPDIVMAKFLAEQGILKFERGNKVMDQPFVVGVKGGI